PRALAERGLDLVAAHDRSIHAEPHVAAARPRDRTTEAGAEAARYRGLHRELAGHAALRAHQANGLQHRGWPAGVDRAAAGGIALEQHREQIGDVAAMAGVAVLARQADLGAVEEVEPTRVGA